MQLVNRFGRKVVIISAIIIFLTAVLTKPVKVTFSTLFFIPQVFPQLPVKPLEWITKEPVFEEVEFISDSKKVTGTIYRIPNKKPKPALIIAMGVRTAENDQLIIANFAKALARIGFVTAVVNLQELHELKIRIEEKETFISSFKYLENQAFVDKNKISFVGISVGSSITLKATQDPQIAEKVRALVFFGGYFDAVDYLASVIIKTVNFAGKEFSWQPKESTVNHLKEVVISLVSPEEQVAVSQVLKEGKKLTPEDFEELSDKSRFAIRAFEVSNREEFDLLWQQAPAQIKQKFEEISPSVGIENTKTRLFILHDKGDQSVSYFESRKLNDALPKGAKRGFLEVSLFDHVQPQKGISAAMIPELFKLYIFIWRTVFFVS